MKKIKIQKSKPDSAEPSLGVVDIPVDPQNLDPKYSEIRKSHKSALIDSSHPASINRSQLKSKRKLIIWLSIGAIAVIVGTIGAYAYLSRSTTKPTPTPEKTNETVESPEPKSDLVASSLTGVEVDAESAKKPIFASIIENMVGNGAARPQSGLSSAGVVYEALAEGGITRYLALWQTDVPQDIGPIRSLRPVFYHMAMEYGAPTSHAGGSTEGLELARSSDFKDMEALGGAPYRRISTRYAPHNLYVYGEKLLDVVKTKGWGGEPTFEAWPRKDDSASSSPTATKISANFSGSDYRAVFRYDAPSNSYLREIGGKADVDAVAQNKQVNPKVVVILKATAVAGKQKNGKPKTDIGIIGKGSGYIFQDGKVEEITWSKSSSTDRMQFLNSAGEKITINRGQTWVSIVPTTIAPSWQ
jgi:hypothetical protein